LVNMRGFSIFTASIMSRGTPSPGIGGDVEQWDELSKHIE